MMDVWRKGIKDFWTHFPEKESIFNMVFSILRKKRQSLLVRLVLFVTPVVKNLHVTGNTKQRLLQQIQPHPALSFPAPACPAPMCRGRRSAAAWICHMASPPDLSFSYGQITSSPWQFAWIKGLANEVEPGDIVWKSAVASVHNCSVKQLSARWRGAQAFLTGWKPSSLEFPLRHKDFTMQSISGHKHVQCLELVLVFTGGCGFSLPADSSH